MGRRVIHVALLLASLLACARARATLPEEYQQVEWIRATGSQRMNLQFWHTATTRVEMVCYIPIGGVAWSVLFGSRNSSCAYNSYYFSSHFFDKNLPMLSLSGSETSSSTIDYFYDQKITLTCNAATKYCGWTNLSGQHAGFTAGGTPTAGVCSWTLFELNRATTHDGVVWDGGPACATVYGMKIWDGPTLRCNLKPCYRKSDNAVGLYDVQRGLFISNLTSTPLECGDPYTGAFAIDPVPDLFVDGVHPAAISSLTVRDEEGTLLVEGRDYTITWPDLAMPGAASASVHGVAGTAYAQYSGDVGFIIRLRADRVKRPYLPAGYIELDGIYGGWSQKRYLNTHHIHTPTTRVECVITAQASANTGWNAPFGSRNGTYENNAYVVFLHNSNDTFVYNRSGAETRGGAFTWGNRTTIVTKNALATWTDGTTTRSVTTGGKIDSGTSPMLVFCENGGFDPCAMTLHAFAIDEGAWRCCELVPCVRTNDWTVGVFDVVWRQPGDAGFHANDCADSTQTFTAGTRLVRPVTVDTNLDFYAGIPTAESVTLGYSVNEPALDGATAKVDWSADGFASLSGSLDLGAVAADYENRSLTLDALAPSTRYTVRMTLSKAGCDDVVRTLSVTTPTGAGAIDPSLTMTTADWTYPTFAGTVTTYGSGTGHVARLCFSYDGQTYFTGKTMDIADTGKFTFSCPWPAYYRKVYYHVVYENTYDLTTYACTSTTYSATLTYTATYTWKSSVADGDWTNAANWTISDCRVPNPDERYPLREKYHTVFFPSASTSVVHLAGSVACVYIDPGRYANVRLVGDGATLPNLTFGALRVWWKGFQLTFDHVNGTWTDSVGSASGGDSDYSDCFGADSCVRLQGGARLAKYGYGGVPMKLYRERARIEVCDGSCYNLLYGSMPMFTMRGSKVLVEDATWRCDLKFELNDGGAAPTLAFAGTTPRLTLNGGSSLAVAEGVNFAFAPSRAGFSAAPLQVTADTFLADAVGTATVEVVTSAPIWRSPYPADFALLRATDGINTNKVRFSSKMRPYGACYWSPANTATPTELRFRLVPRGLRYFAR